LDAIALSIHVCMVALSIFIASAVLGFHSAQQVLVKMLGILVTIGIITAGLQIEGAVQVYIMDRPPQFQDMI
jgi:hypothetical protein